MPIEAIQRFLELLIQGLGRGAVFAMLGLGITLVFGLGGVLNLAIGAFAVLAVIIGVEVYGVVPSVTIAAVVGILAVSTLAFAIDKTALEIVYRSEGDLRIIRGIFVTLGIGLIIDGLLFVYYPSSYSLSAGVGSANVGGVRILGSSMAIIGISAVVFVFLYYFFDRTKLGLAMRTVIQDETGALLVGIDQRKMRTYVFVTSGAIAALAGVLWSFSFEVTPATGFQLAIYAIIVSIVGGVTSIRGAVAAGLFLGVLATFTAAQIGAYVAEIVLFAVVIAVLIYNPEQIT